VNLFDTEPEAPTPDTFLDRLFAQSQSYLDGDRFASIGDATHFYTKVVGVTFEGRQDVVGGMVEGSPIELRRQPENPFDPNAIGVWTGRLQLGYIRRQIAREIARHMDAGERYSASIGSLTGGGTKNFGLNISIVRENAKQAPILPAEGTASASVLEALIGENQLHESQIAVLDRLQAGKNTMTIMGTGRGKSLCFQYPAAVRAIEDYHKTVVLYPLRALANDQYEALLVRLGPLGVRVFRANGSIDMDARADLMRVLVSGEWDIICSTPEFFTYHLDRFATASRPDLIVVDEAHHIFQSKHRAAYSKIGEAIQTLGHPQVLALTATADDDVFEHVAKTLGIEAWVIDTNVRKNLHMVDARGTFNKIKYLQNHIRETGKAIIYTMSRAEATKVAERLRPTVSQIAFYHAGVPTAERTEIERMFRQNELRVVVATSAFGEGIDLPDVRDVFLYHMNFDFTEFNQQSGRAGRDGKDAHIHMLFGEKDRRINDFIIERAAPTIFTLRTVYSELRKLAIADELRYTYVDMANLMQIDKVDASTISAAIRIFADTNLVTIGQDDDGRFVRFHPIPTEKIDLTMSTRFAEGEAEREMFGAFCEVVLNTPHELLENLINQPIYPSNVPLLAG